MSPPSLNDKFIVQEQISNENKLVINVCLTLQWRLILLLNGQEGGDIGLFITLVPKVLL